MTPQLAERRLVLSYAPPKGGRALAAMLVLDDALAQLLRTTSEPALGQIRLQWWREALIRLDHAPPPAEPVLAGLASDVRPHGTTGAALAEVVDGWEVLIEAETLDAPMLERFAEGRGSRLFTLAAMALEGTARDPIAEAGAGWALADLARHLDRPEEAAEARALARPLLDRAIGSRWSSQGRALGAMAHLARRDLDLPQGIAQPVGSPARVARLAWHRITGR